MTVEEKQDLVVRVGELLAEAMPLLEQLAGDATPEGDAADRDENVPPGASSEPDSRSPTLEVAECPSGGEHQPIQVGTGTYCERCNNLLA